MSRTCRLGFGVFPAETAAGINLFDVLAHTWDIAATISIDLDQDNELWAEGLSAAREVIGSARDPIHYAPEIPIPPEEPTMHCFLAFLGRPAEARP